MIRQMCFALVMMILGTLVEYYTHHFFTDYGSVFYSMIGVSWGLFFSLGVLVNDSGRKHHD